jgi:hypothetical protein
MAECAVRRQTLEVGAECPNWARSDLCGGRSAMTVPTASAITVAVTSSGHCWRRRGEVWGDSLSALCLNVCTFLFTAAASRTALMPGPPRDAIAKF